MKENQKSALVNTPDINSVLKNISEDEQEAAQQAYDEFKTLTFGKKEVTMKELYDLKIYARKRTNLEKSNDDLTPEQAVWKAAYNSLEQSLVENMDPEEKSNLDKLQNEMDTLGSISESVKKIVPLGQEIETELVMQHAGLTVYFDKSPENKYKRVVDGVTTDLVDPNKWTPAERIEKAETILKIIDTNREYLYKIQLVERHELIHRKLRDFDDIFRNIESSLSRNENDENDDLVNLFNITKEWLRLTKKLYASRTRAIAAVKNSIDSDEYIPRFVLEKKGDVSEKMSSMEPFFEQMTAVVVLVNQANEEENELAKKRDPISEEIFGKAESYIKFPKDEVAEEVTPAETQVHSNMSNKTKWFIVISLSVIALSLGIWTAIGVFILGMIIINVLSK